MIIKKMVIYFYHYDLLIDYVEKKTIKTLPDPVGANVLNVARTSICLWTWAKK